MISVTFKPLAVLVDTSDHGTIGSTAGRPSMHDRSVSKRAGVTFAMLVASAVDCSCGDGPHPIVLASGLNAPSSITVDSSSIYWTNADDGTVMKVSKEGGHPSTLASGFEN